MTKAEIEQLLEQGERVGFNRPTGDQEYLGWILVSKVKTSTRYLELVGEAEAPLQVAEERRREKQPYLLLRIELKRSVHEAGDYETEGDYRMKDRFWFSTLSDLAEQLTAWGYSLEDAKGARELDAP